MSDHDVSRRRSAGLRAEYGERSAVVVPSASRILLPNLLLNLVR